jgi:hypothetical protein
LGKGTLGPKVGDFQRLFEREAGGHHFTYQSPDLVIAKWSLVVGLEALDHLRFAIRPKKIDAIIRVITQFTLNRGNFNRTAGALIEKFEQLRVDAVNALA